MVLRNGLQAIFRAAAAGYCAGDMRLDNLGISGRSSNVVICDLGGWSDPTCRSVRKCANMFVSSCAAKVREGGGTLSCFDFNIGWSQGVGPPRWLERSDFLQGLFCSFGDLRAVPAQGLAPAAASGTQVANSASMPGSCADAQSDGESEPSWESDRDEPKDEPQHERQIGVSTSGIDSADASEDQLLAIERNLTINASKQDDEIKASKQDDEIRT